MSNITHTPEPKQLHPFCNICGWRKGGVDSWNGTACKCGHSAQAMPGIRINELMEGAEAAALDDLRNAYKTVRSQRDRLIAALQPFANIAEYRELREAMTACMRPHEREGMPAAWAEASTAIAEVQGGAA